MDDQLKQRLTEKGVWLRGFYVVLFAVIFSITEVILTAVVVFQFFSRLFTGQCNTYLLKFGNNLSLYFQQITLFLTFNTDDKPYPFADWPQQAAASPTIIPDDQTKGP